MTRTLAEHCFEGLHVQNHGIFSVVWGVESEIHIPHSTRSEQTYTCLVILPEGKMFNLDIVSSWVTINSYITGGLARTY